MSISSSPAKAEKGRTNAKIKTKAEILIIFPEILAAIFIITTANTKIGKSYASFFLAKNFQPYELELVLEY